MFFCQVEKLIGVQSNHGVEYFGGPAAPTHRFSYNHSKESNAETLVKFASRIECFRTHLVREVFSAQSRAKIVTPQKNFGLAQYSLYID